MTLRLLLDEMIAADVAEQLVATGVDATAALLACARTRAWPAPGEADFLRLA